MLDIGWQELFIVVVLGIMIIGPKDLPRALKAVMRYVRKARGLVREFQSGVDEMVREADLADIKQDVQTLTDGKAIEHSLKKTIDSDGSLTKGIDMTDIADESKNKTSGTISSMENAHSKSNDIQSDLGGAKDSSKLSATENINNSTINDAREMQVNDKNKKIN